MTTESLTEIMIADAMAIALKRLQANGAVINDAESTLIHIGIMAGIQVAVMELAKEETERGFAV